MGNAFTRHLEHGLGVERNIGPRPGILGRRKVVGVDFTGHLEHGDRDFFGQLRPAGKPVGRRPGVQYAQRRRITRVGLGLYIMEGFEDQQGVGQATSRQRGERRVIQQFDQRRDVVATEHGAQQFDRTFR